MARRTRSPRPSWLTKACLALILLTTATAASADEDASFWDKLRDDEDGHFDISELVMSGVGFLPLALPVTEPAIGFGAAVAVTYFHKPKPSPGGSQRDEEQAPPSMSFGGGLLTTNNTWAVAAGHLGVWKDGKIRYLGAAYYADVNLSFFGTEGTAFSRSGGDGLKWNPRVAGIFQELKGNIGSNLYLGGQYSFNRTRNSFGEEIDTILSGELDSDLSAAGLSLSWDNRDNTFTPNRGYFAKALGKAHAKWFGSDFEYEQLDLTGIGYLEIGRLVFGMRATGNFIGDGVPFYGLTYLEMRGVPAFRYLGQHSLQGEIEPRWKLTPRWSILGFFGAGQVVLDVDEFGTVETVTAGGGGFRYLLSRALNMGAGIDVGVGPDETAVYVIIGSHWQGL